VSQKTSVEANPFSKPASRPAYLSALAVVLILWGAFTSLQFVGFTISALSSGRGPVFLLFFLVYMHLLWWALVAAGIGIFRRAEWSRWVMGAALVGLLVGTAMQPFAREDWTLAKLFVYPFLVWLTFTKRSSAYFGVERPKEGGVVSGEAA
jgi:hypothetical protein